jgi:hypothetical protein
VRAAARFRCAIRRAARSCPPGPFTRERGSPRTWSRFEDIAEAMAAAHLVVTRAGAGVLAELAVVVVRRSSCLWRRLPSAPIAKRVALRRGAAPGVSRRMPRRATLAALLGLRRDPEEWRRRACAVRSGQAARATELHGGRSCAGAGLTKRRQTRVPSRSTWPPTPHAATSGATSARSNGPGARCSGTLPS